MSTTTHRAFAAATFAACALLAPGHAKAQLVPEREYYGINRTIPMTAELPSGVAGEVEIALYAPDGGEVAKAAAAAGEVDLAGLFPVLWTGESPRTLYAQLLVDAKPIGPAVVLSPMVNPNLAQPDPSGRIRFPTQPKQFVTYAGIRAWPDRHVVFSTTLGDMEFRMRPEEAPNTVAAFLELVEGGYYTDIIFHRIIGAREGRAPFMAQVGDPTGTGSGGPGRFIDLEPSTLAHDFGVLSMARTADPNTNGGQVFVCFSREGTSFLDGQYCAFAQAVDGAETILALEKVETGAQDRPTDPPVLKSARTIPAPPFPERPGALGRPADAER
ncbi:MAG TPA: peptidylprolyl isomerase [Phycisphaerales bacterium]|nr:peptidylprolyl isomerase [Phycisphaerales bacterium]